MLRSLIPIADSPSTRPRPWWLRCRPGFNVWILLSLLTSSAFRLGARESWTQLNVGPFHVYSQGDAGFARNTLTQAEQLRWILGGLLEIKDLTGNWPVRIVIVKPSQWADSPDLVLQNGQYVVVLPAGSPLPLARLASFLVRDNTPRLPEGVESGLSNLLSSLHADGSRVLWGGAIPHPDLDWARMELFATRFEYSSSFHIFISSLKNGSSIRVAERNAFGKDPEILEAEVASNLAVGHWQAVPVSGRPLDPKRDFGEHTVDGAEVGCYLADAELFTKPLEAERAFKAAIESGGEAMALGYEGLADLARRNNQEGVRFLEDAIRAGSTSAPVYLAVAQSRPGASGLPLLKRAQQLNPRWAEPVFQEGGQTEDAQAKENLYRTATQLNPRGTEYWLALAQLQVKDGHALQAQGTWIRAEDSAFDDAERDRIHQLRMQGETERLDAAEAERLREREAAHLDDQRSQDAETARIRAAEAKANKALDAASGNAKPDTVVPWDETLEHKKLSGILTKIDCGHGSARASIKDRAGRTTQLIFDDPGQAGLSCGQQQPAHTVSLSYAVEPDRTLGVEGRIVSLQVVQ